jgi:hypothetical protein
MGRWCLLFVFMALPPLPLLADTDVPMPQAVPGDTVFVGGRMPVHFVVPSGTYVRYTADSTDPTTANGLSYVPGATFYVMLTTVIKAVAIDTADSTSISGICVVHYTRKLGPPRLVDTTTTFNDNMVISFHQVLDADIYFTLDGTDPDTTSPRYVGPFVIQIALTLKAIAVGTGSIDSDVMVVHYTKDANSTAPVAMANQPFAERHHIARSYLVVDGRQCGGRSVGGFHAPSLSGRQTSFLGQRSSLIVIREDR